jgi:hypothetical protein
MAATLSGEYTVLGNKRVYMGTLTMASTSTTGTVIVPGLMKIDTAVATPVSGATAIFSLHLNVGSATTAINGQLGITSALSSNIFGVLIFGS